ncbi:MAG: ISL3 family transposase [bacterium (Candidatus Ratteibacteria) CG01_land_8_20_14_3_00_40_19]|uniref:ISL3 family transposase n=1 Tax=bacterium (Candidatus Ratteibacteria) CG01_land_8_20_14_3_00_40_19 TaxID=2014290 RepID=A0A2M7E9B9_9BACT|nr:MAG: ISL3 family transposase [bacterium (Candidatus Ratteibacteria) CG01_land_8_20_14_3_00_40_19]
MPDNIIADWLNLPSVKFNKVEIYGVSTEIYLGRDRSLGFTCSGCGQKSFWSWDHYEARIRDLSVFEYKTYLLLDKHRTNCPACGVKIEKLDFADPYSRCTIRFEELVARLCRITSVKQVANLLDLDWKTVKGIDKKYLEKQFAIPDYDGLRLLAVDEIASHKGHNYFTVVMDLERTRVVWVGKSRAKETLDQFFKELGKERSKKIEAVATDMWDPYITSIKEHAPSAKIVFDKFHVIKNYSRVIDKIRNMEFKKATTEKKEAIKGTKYLLLKNRDKLEKDQKEQLQTLLELNQNINIAYMLKDDLKRLWNYKSSGWANKFLDGWIDTAITSNIRPLINFAQTLSNYRYGLINHCRYPIDTGKLEGMNNKIKVIKRIAYGFHDDDYFILKIKQGCSPLLDTS